MCLLHHIGGAFSNKPEELKEGLGSKASALIKRAFEDIDSHRLVDHHTHIAGLGAGETGAFVNPRMLTWAHPSHRLKFKVYLSATDVKDVERADAQLLQRLVNLVKHIADHGKYRLLAFDKHYRQDGSVNLEKTEFYVPNQYVFDLAEQYPDLFEPNISVHPYRPDALEKLTKWAKRGARVVKWLPNAMGMNPSDPRCDNFYQKMKELNLILLSHGGEEKAVQAFEDQELGNPLLLRRALDHGVKVIVAHCAGLGHNEDLDEHAKRSTDNFDLFMRMMNEKKYEGLLFGEISAMTQFNRMGKPLVTILDREDIHERLVNGSDYPLPAVNILIRTRPLEKHGYLTTAERECLNEIYQYNPLLFDFVLKRTMKLPGTNKRLPASVFMTNPELGI